MISLSINGNTQELDLPGDTPLLWVLRDEIGLKGTKFGCGRGLCGACTVHLDGQAVRSCVLPIAALDGQSVTTIEGLDPAAKGPLTEAWIAESVPQCGYCQPGQIMAAAALIKSVKSTGEDLTSDDIRQGMTNLCRCGTYNRIRKAILRAAPSMSEARDPEATTEPGGAQ